MKRKRKVVGRKGWTPMRKGFHFHRFCRTCGGRYLPQAKQQKRCNSCLGRKSQ